MSRPGGAIHKDAPTASTANPEWFAGGRVTAPRLPRKRLHREMLTAFRAEKDTVRTDREAIILAGPPGAGKSNTLGRLVDDRGSNMGEWRVIDADHFKSVLLRQAIVDGSYEGWLVPDQVKQLQAAGERFYPLELAALVHEESSELARQARREAIAEGENVVIDTVLSSTDSATDIVGALTAAGYSVTVVEVEVPLELSKERIRSRWERGYMAAESGEPGSELGGRWVPSEYPEGLYRGGSATSVCLSNAQKLAAESGAVKRFEQYTVDSGTGEPKRNLVKVRPAPGPLVDERTAKAYTLGMAGVTRPPGKRPRPPVEGGRSR